MLNNKDETNIDRRLMILTRDSLMAELGMKHENEGCSLNQLIKFFDNHKISFYAIALVFFNSST